MQLAFLIILGVGFGSCFDRVPPPSESFNAEKSPVTVEDGLMGLSPVFLEHLGRLLRLSNLSNSQDIVDGIIAKTQNLKPYTKPKTPNIDPKNDSVSWNYPPATDTLRKILGTSNWTKSNLCEKLIGGFEGDIIIVPALRANEVSYIGGSIASFIGSKIGIMVMMLSLILNGALTIWVIASTGCCFMHQKKKNYLKKNLRGSAPSSHYSTIRRARRRASTISDDSKVRDQSGNGCGWFGRVFLCQSRSDSETDTLEISAPRAVPMESSDDQRMGVEMENIAIRDPPTPPPAAPPRNSPPAIASDPYANISANKGLQGLSAPLTVSSSSPPPNPFGRDTEKRK